MTPRNGRALRCSAAAWRALTDAVEAALPREACGVCVASAAEPSLIVRVVELPNVHPDPRRGFAFDDGAHLSTLRALERSGELVRAFFHSHPDGDARLSAVDMEKALPHGEPLWPGVDWLVVATREGAMAAVARFILAAGEAKGAPLLIEER